LEAERLVARLEAERGRYTVQGAHSMVGSIGFLSDPGAMLKAAELEVRAAATTGDPLSLAEALMGRGDAFDAEERTVEAADSWAQARKEVPGETPDGPRLRRQALLCGLARREGNVILAVDDCFKEVEIAASEGDVREQAAAWDHLATAQEIAGHEPEMIEASNRSAEFRIAAGDADSAALQLNSLAFHLQRRGMSKEVLSLTDKALKLPARNSRKADSLVLQSRALVQLGELDDARGRMAKALQAVGDDESGWQSILRQAALVPDLKVQELAFRGAGKWVADRGEKATMSSVTIALLLALEARVTGNDRACLDAAKKLIDSSEKSGHIPAELFSVGADLSLRSGDLDGANRYSQAACLRGGRDDCSGNSADSLSSSAVFVGRMLAVEGELTADMADPARKGDLERRLRNSVFSQDEVAAIDREVDAVVKSDSPNPVLSRTNGATMIVVFDPAKALALCESALALLPEDSDPDTSMAVHLAYGEALHMVGRDSEARPHFVKALTIAGASGDSRLRGKRQHEASRRTLGAGFCEEGLPAARQALASYDGPLALPFNVMLGVNKTQCEFTLANAKGPEALLELVPTLASEAEFVEQAGHQLLAAFFYLQAGGALVQKGQLDEGIRWLLRSASCVEHGRLAIADHEVRSKVLGGMIGRMPFSASIAALTQRDSPGDAEEALSIAEQTRAWTLLEEMGKKGIDRAARLVPGDLLAEEVAAAKTVEGLTTRLMRVQAERPWDEAAISDVQRGLDSSFERLKAIEESLWSRVPAYASLRYPRPIQLGQVPLAPDELILEFRTWKLAGVEGVHAWLVGRRTDDGEPEILLSRRITENAGELEAQVTRYAEWLRSPTRLFRDEREPPAELLGLAQALVSPVLAHIDPARHRRLLVVPDGTLHLLPLEAIDLSSLGGCMAREGEVGKYLADCIDVRYLPSISTLSVRRSVPAPSSPGLFFLGLGDPVFFAEDGRVREGGAATPTVTARCAPLSRLPQSAREVELAAASLCANRGPGCVTLVGLDASESRWRAALGDRSGAAILHLATHTGSTASGAECLSLSPGSEPALVFSLPSDSLNDGMLSRTEIMGLDLKQSRLAVLSACSSAAGSLDPDQGLAGLASAFLYAGAEEVLATMWPISDEEAALMMEEFYASYATNADASSALARARRAMRATPRTDDPFFWSSFVLYGARAPEKGE